MAAAAGAVLPFCCSPGATAAAALAPAGSAVGLPPAEAAAAFSGVQVGSKWLFRPSQHW